MISKDETAIIASTEYAAGSDILLGFFEKESGAHSYIEDDIIHVEEGESAYNSHKICSMAQAVILNPLHPHLLKIPVLIHLTCNQFDAAFLRQQWNKIKMLYNLSI